MPTEFRNEPFTDFSKEENAQAMRAALAKVATELGREYPLVIGGERINTDAKLESINPANRTQVVGRFQKATKDLANKAVESAYEAFQSWKNTDAAERADFMFRIAAILRDRKHEFSAWMVHEVAKTWAEADGDTAEAIDFLEFYGREMLRYGGPQPLINIPGEENHLDYIPLGVVAVIPPWNFPLAIMAGMTSAAFVTGNTVVLKPSSDAPSQTGTPLSGTASVPSLADAFAALLSAEQGRRVSPSTVGSSAISDEALEDIIGKVIARMSDGVVRDAVIDVAERLVREEIERIKVGR